MAYSLSLSVFSPDSSILEVAQVKSVRVRLKGDSWLSIYPGHAALIGEVLPGDLMYSAGELQARLALPSSIIKVSDNQITVFVSKSYDFDNEEDARFAEDDQDKRFDNLARMLMQTMVDQDTEDFHP